MTPKGKKQKTKNTKPKYYADYRKDAVNKGEMTEEEAREAVTQFKTGRFFYNKKLFKNFR